MKQQVLTKEQHAHIACCLAYNSETGIITTRQGSKKTVAGMEVGYLENNGYRRIKLSLNGKTFRVLAHLVAWFLHYGVWPTHEVDHEDRVRDHNWIKNLRKAVEGQNQQNMIKSKTNKHGYRGVMKTGSKYYGQIWFNGSHEFSKLYDTPLEAHQWYLRKQKQHHGKFAVGAGV